jgi:hypothetical protein
LQPFPKQFRFLFPLPFGPATSFLDRSSSQRDHLEEHWMRIRNNLFEDRN